MALPAPTISRIPPTLASIFMGCMRSKGYAGTSMPEEGHDIEVENRPARHDEEGEEAVESHEMGGLPGRLVRACPEPVVGRAPW